MKKLLYLLLAYFLFATLAFGQYGSRIHFGTAFESTDSTRITSNVDNTAADGATVYSPLVATGKLEGSYGVRYYASANSGTPTFTVYARFWYRSGPALKHWGDWNVVFSGAAVNTNLFVQYVQGSSLTWWHQSDGIQ